MIRIQIIRAKDLPGQLAAFGINGSDAASLFMSHPPLEVVLPPCKRGLEIAFKQNNG
jgi:hypothetical protein